MLNYANFITGSIEFKGDDSEGVDVPFFSWRVIQAATSNFADANMLGTGGFGSVFRVNKPTFRLYP